jgi:hypothetical protein
MILLHEAAQKMRLSQNESLRHPSINMDEEVDIPPETACSAI